jgi:F-type H+-transporting ATPase subunit a
MKFSPFEQFEISLLIPLRINSFIDLSITNAVIYLIMGGAIITVLAYLATFQVKFLATTWQNLFETFYIFLYGLLVEQAGKKAKIYFPFIFALFSFILILNLIGLTPYGFTVTGHISVTFGLAFTFFVAWIIVGFKTLGFNFFRIFLPSGIPNWLVPLLVVIEVLSFLLRPLSLAIRLFANVGWSYTFGYNSKGEFSIL